MHLQTFQSFITQQRAQQLQGQPQQAVQFSSLQHDPFLKTALKPYGSSPSASIRAIPAGPDQLSSF